MTLPRDIPAIDIASAISFMADALDIDLYQLCDHLEMAWDAKTEKLSYDAQTQVWDDAANDLGVGFRGIAEMMFHVVMNETEFSDLVAELREMGEEDD